MVAEVRLFIRVNDEQWICKGSQIGQMQIVKGNVGDSFKGAITDAIQKCLSLLSIGTDAYRGLLRDVYLSVNRPDPLPPKQQLEQPAQSNQESDADKAPHNSDLPKIAGISYQHRDGIVIAVGNSFDKKDLLKSAGFKWDKSDKSWFKEVLMN